MGKGFAGSEVRVNELISMAGCCGIETLLCVGALAIGMLSAMNA